MTDRLDDTSIQVVVNRLEARGKHPVFAQMLADYLDAMLIDPAETVLDLGCGTGMVARAIARRRLRCVSWQYGSFLGSTSAWEAETRPHRGG
jgi:2-polyprenyl-3-methyl-5-hydroxy-6-metoxy-1,4-benzoquinol methylase